MNLQQAKQIPITWFFDRVLGLHGTQSANDILYPSPFRTDNKPSYSVSIRKNISYDFATGEARDLVDSIAHHYGLSMSGSLKKLEELFRLYPTAEYNSLFQQKPFKCAIGNKDITVIVGTQNSNTVLIFEGMFDFLSYLEYEKTIKPKDDVIVLNSVAIWERGVEWVKSKAGIEEIHLYLDNDKAGVETVERIRNCGVIGIEIIDKSSLYKRFKDFGEWWCEK